MSLIKTDRGGTPGSGGVNLVDWIEVDDEAARFALVVPDDLQEGDDVKQLSPESYWKLTDDANVGNSAGWKEFFVSGGGSLQASYDLGGDIDLATDKPVQIRDNGIAYGNSPIGILVDRTVDESLAQFILSGQEIPSLLTSSEMLADTAVTFPASIADNTETTFSFDQASHEIRDSANGFVAAGHLAGDFIAITGTTNNNKTFKIVSVAVGVIVVDDQFEDVVDEGAGASVTLDTFANKIAFTTTDLTAKTPPISIGGVTSAFLGSLILLKDADVPADESVYFAETIDGTGLIVGMTLIATGQPPDFTSTSGTAKIGLLETQRIAASVADPGAPLNSSIKNAGQSGSAVETIISDSASLSALKAFINAGDLSGGMIILQNFGPAFGKAADKPFIVFSAPLAQDAEDLVWTPKSSDPSSPGAGGEWYKTTTERGITGRKRYRDSSGTDRSQATLDDIAGLNETLTFGGGATGEVLDLTITNGLITARTLVP